MEAVQRINSFNDLKIISDPRRLMILRQLMKSPATLSQLGNSLGMSAARVRHHLKILEDNQMVELVRTQAVRGFFEKYYRATSQAYFINTAVLPIPEEQGTIYLVGSHDPALEMMVNQLKKEVFPLKVFTIPVGSLEGLVALRQGLCQMTGCHLYDPIAAEYNTPYVRHFFPGQKMHIVTLAHRQQGLLVSQGNPRNIRNLVDLAREDVIFINRKRGSGTRLWLDQNLRDIGIEPDLINGYDHEVSTHSQVAERILSGNADVGLAVLAVAQDHLIDFIPLFEERFDLVIPEHEFSDPNTASLLDFLNTKKIRNQINNLFGYRTTETGKEILIF